MTASNASSAKLHLAQQVKNHLAEHFADEHLEEKYHFIDVFWAQLTMPDWQQKEVGDIAGCCNSLWLLLRDQRELPLIQVFNPSMEEHGWLTGGTVVMVCQEDMPFLVDSIRLELNRRGLPIHIIKSTLVTLQRDSEGGLKALHSLTHRNGKGKGGWEDEALIYVEIGQLAERDDIYELKSALAQVLSDVKQVVKDYPAVLEKSAEVRTSLANAEKNKAVDGDDLAEATAFLDWLEQSHFTYLGYRELEYEVNKKGELTHIREAPDSQLGLFSKYCSDDPLRTSAPDASIDFYKSNEVIAISKSSTRSSVHRAVYPDYIVVKRFDEKGRVTGEIRILGLFTYAVYTLSTRDIPIIRRKAQRILERSGLLPASHDGKNLHRVMETYPRDEFFQADFETLYNSVMSVAAINEKGSVRLIMRHDPFHKFLNCIAYVPRDAYNTKVRQSIEQLIGDAVDSEELDSATYFSESVLARAYMVFRLKEGSEINYDPEVLEQSVIELTRGWIDRFYHAVLEAFGDSQGAGLYKKYRNAFSLGYQEHFDPRTAVADIKLLACLQTEQDIAMHLYQPQGAPDLQMRFKVLHMKDALELSDVVPILENLGLRVLGEHPFKLAPNNDDQIWLHDFTLKFGLNCDLEVQTVSRLFENAFAAIWRGEAESDAFNRLVISARLDWREVSMLRAYAAYMKQTDFTFSQDYIADTLVNQVEITRNLVALFKACFDPRVNAQNDSSQARIDRLSEKILKSLEEVDNLNEDKILRRYFDLIQATLRTNFYQSEGDQHKDYMSFKVSPRELKDIPEPKPLFEIYLYSPRVEGVHLRGGKVARGGIRWSDRHQDYRTEVLGLVKAQQVKNAVIVPSGAKGGFVAKKQHLCTERDQIMEEGIACYKIFMSGLLDITDNVVDGKITRPDGVICKDEEDTYLVVAADKGTATFSDIANEVSQNYNHWLGDAFASGGSQGYDHKKMGITAKGAWVSVQRHFREMGTNVQDEDFTVVGIGDMAGDVFGNGMLCSEHIRLVAAFNHAHIFIDPDPDPKASYKERKRLFELPRSSWEDYNQKLISKGGGIFARKQKSIKITPEMKKAFDIEQSSLSSPELIRHLLMARVGLIWNGGIGTYVKSEAESNEDVGDKSNDALRVNGGELRCKVFGEGGNLGMTQLGRVEYSLAGGRCNTDFIDNAAGVDCSDHEVNIKILLQQIVRDGDLTTKQRNQLLEKMTQQVSDLVLNHNYLQTQALSMAETQAAQRAGEYRRFIRTLEAEGKLDRTLEFLPSEETFAEREKQNQSFTRPELAVLLSYAKVVLKETFIEEDLTTEPVLAGYVELAFPELLIHKFKKKIYKHPLLKEIVATQVANDMVHILGITAAQRLADSTGSSLKQVAVAFACSKKVFRMDDFMQEVRSQDNQMSSADQYELLANMARRVRRATRWFLRNRRGDFNPSEDARFFSENIPAVNRVLKDAVSGEVKDYWEKRTESLANFSISDEWRLQLAVPDYMYSGMSAVEVGRIKEVSVEQAGLAQFALYEYFELNWLAKTLSLMNVENAWQAKARESYLDDLDTQLRLLVSKFFSADVEVKSARDVIEWARQHEEASGRWLSLVHDVRAENSVDFAMISVLMGELVDCVSNKI